MTLNINQFRANLPNGGARNTRFQIYITNPANPAGDIKVPFQARASTLPPSSLGTIVVPFVGRQIKLPGDRVYPPWQVTIMNDMDFPIRDALESWSAAINTPEGNLNVMGDARPADLKSQGTIQQMDLRGNVVRVYQFEGIWPAEISEIDLDWGATDRIQEFNVTFAYDWWTVSGGTTGDAGGR